MFNSTSLRIIQPGFETSTRADHIDPSMQFMLESRCHHSEVNKREEIKQCATFYFSARIRSQHSSSEAWTSLAGGSVFGLDVNLEATMDSRMT